MEQKKTGGEEGRKRERRKKGREREGEVVSLSSAK